MRVLTRSMMEEIIGVLWLIAALLAWISGIRWMAYIFFIKGFGDIFIAITIAYKQELKKEIKNRAYIGNKINMRNSG